MVQCTIRVKVILRRTIFALPNGATSAGSRRSSLIEAGFELSKEINLTLTQAESRLLSCPRNTAVLKLRLARLASSRPDAEETPHLHLI